MGVTVNAKQTPRRSNLNAFLSLTAKQIADLEAENYIWYARMAETRLSAVATIARSVFPNADSALVVIGDDFAGLIGALDEFNGSLWREDFDDDTAMQVVEQHQPEFAAATDLLFGLLGNPAVHAAARPAERALTEQQRRDLLIFGYEPAYWVITLPRTTEA
jgi:hypothetical protein